MKVGDRAGAARGEVFTTAQIEEENKLCKVLQSDVWVGLIQAHASWSAHPPARCACPQSAGVVALDTVGGNGRIFNSY